MRGEDETPRSPSRALAATPARSAYEVGYGKPPEASRFQPGRSGNPRGRPKGARNRTPRLNEERLKAIVLDEAYREVPMRDGDRPISVPIARAVIRALGVKAVKGDHRSQRLFAELLGQTESANKLLHDEWLDVAMTYKIEWERELERRERLGITNLPDPLPHPDHIRIDMRAGEVRVVGPWTREEKAEFDKWVARKAMFEQQHAELRQELADETRIVLGTAPAEVDQKLADRIANSIRWMDELRAGASMDAIARREGVPIQRLTSLLRLALLAPDIVEAISAGAQPARFTVDAVIKSPHLALWSEQRRWAARL